MVGAWVWTYDGVRADEQFYEVQLSVPAADGVYAGTPVRIAGVEVGAVEAITLAGERADLTLRIRSEYQLPTNSEGGLKATGLLGDYHVRVWPGDEPTLLEQGGRIRSRDETGDLDIITKNIEDISDDIAAITKVLREVVEDRKNVDHVEATLANVDALTAEMRLIAEQNRHDIGAIIDSVRRLTESLEGYTDDIAADVDDEMDRLKDLTDDLDKAAEDLGSITGKIDRGEGTLGALVNDDETIELVNETVDEARRAVRSFTGLKPQIYYTGRFYMGTRPNDLDTFYYGNPLAWSAANTIGIKLRAHEDFWYVFEVNDHPQGVISQQEVLREETGTVESRWTRAARFRFTFMVEKRWKWFSGRLGIKENGGGVGISAYALRDKLQFDLDVFDFFFGSYPAIQDRGIPNIRFNVRVQPVRNFYIDAGTEQIILGAKYGYFTGYLGLGFTFTDDDVRWLLGSIPGL